MKINFIDYYQIEELIDSVDYDQILKVYSNLKNIDPSNKEVFFELECASSNNIEDEDPYEEKGQKLNKTLHYVENCVDENFKMSMHSFLRTQHYILMEGDEYAEPGSYRSIQNWIGDSNSTIETATYVPPAPALVHPLLDNLFDWMYEFDDMMKKYFTRRHSIIQAAFFHYYFESIHPFVDGNGRIGRSLVQTILLRDNTIPFVIPISSYIYSQRQRYYNFLRDLRHGKQEDMVRYYKFFLEAVKHAIK